MGQRSARLFVDVTPSASRLTSSLRDIGYDFSAAVADIVDNSISAGARRIDVVMDFEGRESRVIIADDGRGMSESDLNEALRFGSRRLYGYQDLGRFGLGLKTASLSQCRRLTVVTRRTPVRPLSVARELNLDLIDEVDRWIVVEPLTDDAVETAKPWLKGGVGTVVIWDDLDRVLPEESAEGGGARRRFGNLAKRCADYLGMVFHRFLEGEAAGELVRITVNGEKVQPWNPFAPGEPERVVLPENTFELVVGDSVSKVRLRPYVLPARNLFSSAEEFERLSGARKWNRQQGLYVYRADRLIQSGGWSGLRAADEHTKLARVALDFPTSLDELFQVNVAKMRVSVPSQLRMQLDRPVKELCGRAQAMYRRDGVVASRSEGQFLRERGAAGDAGTALRAAAFEIGEKQALARIIQQLQARSPALAELLGFA